MTFPNKLLHDDEHVLVDTRPHWSKLFVPAVVALVAIGGVSAIFVIWSSAPSWFGWVLLAIVLIGVCYFLGRYLKWRSTAFVVTSMRVIYRTGVLHRVGREIPVSSVQNVEYGQTLLERVLRKGHISVESAGAHGDEPFADIPKPAIVQGLINKAIDHSTRRDTDHLDVPSQPAIADEIERLDDLHRRGVITDVEFSRLKKGLIDDETAAGDGH